MRVQVRVRVRVDQLFVVRHISPLYLSYISPHLLFVVRQAVVVHIVDRAEPLLHAAHEVDAVAHARVVLELLHLVRVRG